MVLLIGILGRNQPSLLNMNSERMAPKLPHICCNHTLPVATGGKPQSAESQLPQYESWYSNGFACKSANNDQVGIDMVSGKKKEKVKLGS